MIRRAYRSRLGGLWTDRYDAVTQVMEQLREDKISPEEAGQLLFWIKYGYLVIKNAVPESVIDQFNSDIDEAWRGKYPQLKLDLQGQHLLVSPELRSEKTKILDFHFFSEAARQVVLSEEIVKFLQLIFRESPLLFQSLYLERSTEQLLHQDVAYVVVNPPMEMAGIWLALEDVQEGSGELFCYEKSHKIEEFLFAPSRKFWNTQEDDVDIHKQFLYYLNNEIKSRVLPVKKFRIEKGDTIVLMSDLAYGEFNVAKPKLTRKSILAHCCTCEAIPRYFTFSSNSTRCLKFQKSYYSTQYY